MVSFLPFFYLAKNIQVYQYRKKNEAML